MVVEKEDLGLSLTLSLSFPHEYKTVEVSNNHHLSNHFSTSSPPLITPFSFITKSATWPQALPSSSPDVGCTHDKEAEGGSACSPNSTISSSSGGKRSISDEDNYGCQVEADHRDRACSRGTSDEDEEADNDNSFRNNSNKKLRLSKDQAAVLEETFKDHNTLNPKQKTSLAKRLGLRPRQVEVWFQNRRARTKLKQTEVDCEYLKRCCETLTEENRRLQKEVQQLRAIKLSPQLYMQMPPTTLTVCPSCHRGAARPWGRAFDRVRSGS